MARKSKTQCIGILTAGGDCPGLNAAIRGVAKAAINEHDIKVIGILDGFRGLIENRTVMLDNRAVSGILTHGGTILGTSRDKPHKMSMGGHLMDMTSAAVENARRLGIDCLVCLGGGGTQKNALHLHEVGGMNVMTLPKTIDNDVFGTDISFGFDTGDGHRHRSDRPTAHDCNEPQPADRLRGDGHRAGWLALGAGLAGGADVILIPEIPYDLNKVAEHLLERRRNGKRFSIITVSEAARAVASKEPSKAEQENRRRKAAKKKSHRDSVPPAPATPDTVVETSTPSITLVQEAMASRLARQLQQLTETEARVTSLGHVQRGGVPSATDRLLCTRLGVRAVELLAEGTYNVMVAVRGGNCDAVPLKEVAGRKKTVPHEHPGSKSPAPSVPASATAER